MNFELDYIKVPEGLSRRCRKRGIYTSILFWYKLKPIKKTGMFPKETFISTIQSYYNLSQPTIYRHLKILKELGCIKENSKFYSLISYNKLFHILDYNLTFKQCKKGFRKGNFAIDKIDNVDIPNIKERIDCGELKLSLRRQKFIVGSTMSKIKDTVIKKDSSKIFYDGLNMKINHKPVNPIIGISSKGICRLVGLKSTKSAHDLKTRSVQNQLLYIYHQEIILKEKCNFFDEAFLHHILHKKSNNYRGSFGQPLTYVLQDTFDFLF